jgi:hypothetical protein
MPRPADPASQAISHAIAADDVLAEAARGLAAQAIATAQHYLTYGSPVQQMRIVTALLPSIGKALAGQGEDEEMAEVRTQLRALQQGMLDAG